MKLLEIELDDLQRRVIRSQASLWEVSFDEALTRILTERIAVMHKKMVDEKEVRDKTGF